jgi:predicted outer membrane protein
MKTSIFTALLALTALASQAMAQSATETQPSTTPGQTPPGQATPGRVSPQSQPGQTGQARQASNLDQQIAACALLSNQEEVALAKMGAEKAKHDDVKKFAEMLIEQHQQAISKIEQAAPQVASWNLTLRNAEGDSQPENNQQAGAGALPPELLMARQIHEECLALTKKALSEKEGADFDKAFLGQQYMAHIGMLAGIKGSTPFASQQMKPLLQEAEKMTEEHLAKAKELMEQVKDSEAPRQARAGQ